MRAVAAATWEVEASAWAATAAMCFVLITIQAKIAAVQDSTANTQATIVAMCDIGGSNPNQNPNRQRKR